MLAAAISGDEEWVLADKTYDTAKNRELLEQKGIKNGILITENCKKKLSVAEKDHNRVLSRLRCPVERVFGTWKRCYRYSRARYLGLKKNTLQLVLTSIAYNLRRMEKLCA